MKLATKESPGAATRSVGVPSCRIRPSADDADPVRERRGVLEVVGDEHGGQPERLEQLAQLGADARPRVRVERGERLVQQEDLRIACERSRERDALALSARELA